MHARICRGVAGSPRLLSGATTRPGKMLGSRVGRGVQRRPYLKRQLESSSPSNHAITLPSIFGIELNSRWRCTDPAVWSCRLGSCPPLRRHPGKEAREARCEGGKDKEGRTEKPQTQLSKKIFSNYLQWLKISTSMSASSSLHRCQFCCQQHSMRTA